MKLDNVHPIDDLTVVARQKRKSEVERSVLMSQLEKFLREGWTAIRTGRRVARIRKAKQLNLAFEDRVWMVLFQMGFRYLSGDDGARLHTRTPGGTVSNQLDAVAIDDDTAVFVECRSAAAPKKAPRLDEDLTKLHSMVKPFSQAVGALDGPQRRRKIAPIYWSYNLIPTDNDRERAKASGVRLFDEQELAYYESLVAQIGQAARFQFLADVFDHAEVPGLEVVVPAIRVDMGPTRCFAFPISPEALLKISYVSHKLKGAAGDIGAYQRLLKRSKIKQIREYLDNKGYFPTNVVVSLRAYRKDLRFDQAKIPDTVRAVGNHSPGSVGYLYLPTSYKSAWIIDGQHRLLAFAGRPDASTARLTVLAFENLDAGNQAKLFVDINSKQKAVSRNLLAELWADLAWESEDPVARSRAIISKLILRMDQDPDSTLFGRIKRADSSGSEIRCITLQSITNALNKPELFIGLTRGVAIPGAFWMSTSEKTLRRARKVIDAWLSSIVANMQDNWDRGKGEGGFLGMNDGLTALCLVLRSVVRYLSSARHLPFSKMSDEELSREVAAIGGLLGRHLATLDSQAIASLRAKRGTQGQTYVMRKFETAIRAGLPDFRSEGLDKFILDDERRTNEEAAPYVTRIESLLHGYILGLLKEEYGEEGDAWWYEGVPKPIRERIVKDIEDEGKAIPREEKFYLRDYRVIAQYKWKLFGDVLGRGRKNDSKDARTEWMQDLNVIRNQVFHPTKPPISGEQLEIVKDIDRWLSSKLRGMDDSDGDGDGEDDED